MKQSLVFLFLSVIFLPLQLYASSSGNAGQNITWHLDDDGVLSFEGEGKMKNFGQTPYNPILVKKIVIDNGITSIGNNAFKKCTKLTIVSIPPSIVEIGDNAFEGCKSLPSITIPYGVSSIGKQAFANCERLTELDLPGSVKSIGEGAFQNCRDLVKIRIPSSLISMGKEAFKNCYYIELIYELPEFLTSSVAERYNLSSRLVSNYWEKQKVSDTISDSARKSNNSDENHKNQKVIIPKSDVDVSIPHTGLKNEKTVAVIVSNENYTKLPEVPFALNDGLSFFNYCKNTLGIPEQNILLYKDATSGQMRDIPAELGIYNRILGSDMKVIFYYSGHGAPDQATNDSYLIPVDALRVNPTTCLSLSELYSSLGKLNVEFSTVFLDACFSGGERNGGNLLASNGERVVKIKQQEIKPSGNMVVFTATDGDQTALPYNEKGHGIFTYFLLKKLKDTGGSVSFAELADYLKTNVGDTALKQDHKEQTPTVSISSALAENWRTQRLIN